MKKDEIVQRFLKEKVVDENVLAVIAFGSYARGNDKLDSDVDLVIILKDGEERSVEEFEGQTFEIIYTTEEKAFAYWESHKQEAVRFWQIAKVLDGDDELVDRLEHYREKMAKEKPIPVSESDRKHLEFNIVDQLKAVRNFADTDSATAWYLLHQKVDELTDIFFDLREEWRPAPKQKLVAIRERDEELGALFDTYYSTHELEKAIEITDQIRSMIFKS